MTIECIPQYLWFVSVDTDFCGTNNYYLVQAETESEASAEADILAYENAISLLDEEDIYDEGYYAMVEPYDPKIHNEMLSIDQLSEFNLVKE